VPLVCAATVVLSRKGGTADQDQTWPRSRSPHSKAAALGDRAISLVGNSQASEKTGFPQVLGAAYLSVPASRDLIGKSSWTAVVLLRKTYILLETERDISWKSEASSGSESSCSGTCVGDSSDACDRLRIRNRLESSVSVFQNAVPMLLIRN